MSRSGTTVADRVRAWCVDRTGVAEDWTTEQLTRVKAGRTVSVVLPARDEDATVGAIVTAIRAHLMERVPLVDDLVVVNSRSMDRTAQVALAAGARVVGQDDMTRGLPRLEGKGDALWAGLAASVGDVIAFIDADLRQFRPEFVTGLLGPLLTDPAVAYVKGFYHRPLERPGGLETDGGGRVTELVARPLFNLFWPELAGFVQPLAGEYAGRRDVLERVPFVSGYGVEAALLIDLLELVGLDALAQVDLGERRHRHQDIEALGRMAGQIMVTVWHRLHRRGLVDLPVPPQTLLTQFRRAGTEAVPNLNRDLVVSDVSVRERPPLAVVREATGWPEGAPG